MPVPPPGTETGTDRILPYRPAGEGGNTAAQGKRELRVKHNFYLVYLWYDVLGRDGFLHQEEINQFASIAEKDNIHFKAITYQEVIANLSESFYEGNEAYCDYLTERYL